MTIVEFLLARITEDEETARSSAADAMSGWRWKHYPQDAFIEIQQLSLDSRRRLRAECQAKRAIVHQYEGEVARGPAGPRDDFVARHGGIIDAYSYTLRLLAAVYADHADYRQEWRP